MVPPFVRLAAHPLRWQLLTELADSDYRVRELVARLGQPQNLVSYHLRLLRDGGLVTATRSSYDGRDSYYRLDLDRCAAGLAETGAALHPALHPAPCHDGTQPSAAPQPALRHDDTQPSAAPRQGGTRPGTPGTPSNRKPVGVLFLCTGNSARSPIAEALLRHHAADHAADHAAERVSVASAGIRPKPHMHPNAVRVLEDRFGIDIAGQRPRHLETLAGRRFDHVITLCDKAREACAEFPYHPRRAHWSIPDPATAGYAEFQSAATDIETRIRYLLPTLTNHRQEVQP